MPAAGETSLQQIGQTAPKNFSLKIDVDLVTVDAIVRDRQGAIVGELQAGDFAIYDNGIPQEITHLSRDQLPLAVALVIDCSPSIKQYLKDLHGAALAALGLLKPEDQVALFSLAQCPARLTELTSDHSQLVSKIGALEVESGTNIYDALVVAARYLREQAPDRRHAIILISDDYSDTSYFTAAEALREMLQASVTLLNIKTLGDNGLLSHANIRVDGSPLDLAKTIPNIRIAVPDIIEHIAGETGGEVFNLGGGGKLARAFETVISNLKLQYTLGFVPSDTRTGEIFHRLEVKLSGSRPCLGCKVQARSGYYLVAPSSPVGNSTETSGTHYDCEDLKATLEDKLISMAAANAEELHNLLFQVITAKDTDAAGLPQIKVHLKIDSALVGFKMVEGKHLASLRVAVVYADPKGHDLGTVKETIDLKLNETDYTEVKRWGIPFATAVPLKVPKQVLKIIVFDMAAGKVGSKFVKTK
jgi:Ca-activated chloride channel family protein